jgi:hypothetical protein
MTDADRTPHELAPAGCASAGTGYLMPDVALHTAAGERVALGEHARRNLVVVLRGDGGPEDSTRSLLAALAASGAQLEAEEARVVVIGAVETAAPWTEWTGAVPPLFTTDVSLYARLDSTSDDGRPRGAVFVTDRFREIYAAFREGGPGWPPTVDEILRWLVFIDIQCPECGAPEW